MNNLLKIALALLLVPVYVYITHPETVGKWQARHDIAYEQHMMQYQNNQ